MIRTLTVMAGAALALGAGATAIANHHGGGKMKGEMRGDKGAMMEAHFAEMDADKSGAVSEDEFLAFALAKAKAKFAEIGGEDGSLTLDEMKAHHTAKMESMKEMHQGYKQKMMDDAAEEAPQSDED